MLFSCYCLFGFSRCFEETQGEKNGGRQRMGQASQREGEKKERNSVKSMEYLGKSSGSIWLM